MRTSMTRVLAAMAATLALAAVTTTSGVASVNGCPTGRVGLVVQWADAQVSYACAPLSGQQDAAPVEIVGLLVRQADGSVRTIDLAAAPSSATRSPAVSSSSSSTSSSISTSTSTSTTCVNGQCTTTSDHSVCVDGNCSDGQ